MFGRPKLRRRSRLLAVTAAVLVGHLLVARAFDLRGPGDGGLMLDNAIDVSMIEWAASTPTAPQAPPVEPTPPSEPPPSESAAPETPAEPPPPPPPPPEAISESTPPPEPPPPTQAAPPQHAEAPPGPTIAQRVAALMAKQARMPGGRACQFAQALQVVLQEDAGVQAALELMPRKSRSVANAVMLWNGQWVDEAQLGGALAIDPIKAAFVEGVSGAPKACQTRLMRGPLFIPIAQHDETIMLAVGSGEWRWADMVEHAVAVETIQPSIVSRITSLWKSK